MWNHFPDIQYLIKCIRWVIILNQQYEYTYTFKICLLHSCSRSSKQLVAELHYSGWLDNEIMINTASIENSSTVYYLQKYYVFISFIKSQLKFLLFNYTLDIIHIFVFKSLHNIFRGTIPVLCLVLMRWVRMYQDYCTTLSWYIRIQCTDLTLPL